VLKNDSFMSAVGGAMPFEIERKFLVRDESWRASAGAALSIRQGYLTRNESMTTRIRIIDEVRAKLTIKSPVSKSRKLEFEYEIPLADAATLIALRKSRLVEKRRYKLPWHGLIWDIDVFQGDNQGLVIAEIELPHENEVFETPNWLGREVTADSRYSNANLAKTPYRGWPAFWQVVHAREPRGSQADHASTSQAECSGLRAADGEEHQCGSPISSESFCNRRLSLIGGNSGR
jgi:adenylate cyclase